MSGAETSESEAAALLGGFKQRGSYLELETELKLCQYLLDERCVYLESGYSAA